MKVSKLTRMEIVEGNQIIKGEMKQNKMLEWQSSN